MTILLKIAYDGTDYAGWQRQENALAIQQCLEDALSALLKQEIKLTGASRTDAGVHALGQMAAFSVECLAIPVEKLPQVINGYLPKDIIVLTARVVEDGFNPRFRAKSKTYRYQMHREANPLLSRYSVLIPSAVNIEEMEKAAACFEGTHDFTAFCASGSSAKTFTRTIYSCKIEQDGQKLCMIVSGDAFLYNMVRIMAGTILYAGKGKLEEEIPAIIASKDRSKAGKTMPPEGLCLAEVRYEEEL